MDRQSFEEGIFCCFLFLEGTFFDFEGKSLIKTKILFLTNFVEAVTTLRSRHRILPPESRVHL